MTAEGLCVGQYLALASGSWKADAVAGWIRWRLGLGPISSQFDERF